MGRSGVTSKINGEVHHFCCIGCQHVFLILFHNPEGPPVDFRKTELYRSCLASGLIARGMDENRDSSVPNNQTQHAAAGAAIDESLCQELIFRVDGMWCSACSWLIEEVLRKSKGIVKATVTFASDTAQIKYMPHRITPNEIISRVSRLGYSAALPNDLQDGSSEKRNLLLRFGISAILTVNAMMISFALYYGFIEEIGQEGVRYLSYPAAILSALVVFYGGFPILKRAFVGLRYGGASMDTLVASGALAAYIYSIVQMMSGSLHVYFDTAAMLVTLVLLGKYIETEARDKVSRSITELYRMMGGKVRLSMDNREKWVSQEAIAAGDEFLVLEGERCPVDGRIASGKGMLDISALTGESRPVSKSMGDEILAGSLLLEGELKLEATHVGSESSLSQLVSLMQEALSTKNNVERLADNITRRIVPAVLLLSLCTGLFLFMTGSTSEEAIIRALSVLVITCPCALGIATPLAKVATIGIGRSEGILIRDHGALEKVRDLDAIVFDKTGTLTEGNFTLREIVTVGIPEDEALRRIASIEINSNHFIAKEAVRKASEKALELDEATDFESIEGMGVKGIVATDLVFVGNRGLMEMRGLLVPPVLDRQARMQESGGSTVVFFAWRETVHGFMIFGDAIRNDARRLVDELHARGVSIWLVSGDSTETTRAVAMELGITQFEGKALPRDKVESVRRLQADGLRVGMIGDGMNDAAALAAADVGFAIGGGANILQESSDITFLGADPTKLLKVLQLSELAWKVIRENLFFAFVYNALGIPLAMAGFLNPLVAVAAMFASSLTVTANTLRISRSFRTPVKIPKGLRRNDAG